jgi:hypothetical protein
MMIPGNGSRLQEANRGGVENDTRVLRQQQQERLRVLAINAAANPGGNDWRGVMHYSEGPLYQHNFTPNECRSFRTIRGKEVGLRPR